MRLERHGPFGGTGEHDKERNQDVKPTCIDHLRRFTLKLLAALVLSAPLCAQQSPPYKAVLTGLDQPVCLEVHADRRRVLVGEAGAGRVIVFSGEASRTIVHQIAHATWPGGGPATSPGALALVSSRTLAVGHATADGAAAISLFPVPEDSAAATPADSIAPLASIVLPADNSPAQPWDVILQDTTLVLSALNGESALPLWMVDHAADGELARPERFGPPGIAGAAGLVRSPRGELVVAGAGKLTGEPDATLQFLHWPSGRVLLNFQTDRFDLVSLAYSPKGGLYAVDMGWNAPEQAGLYRLDAGYQDGRLIVQSTRIARLARPTCLRFANDGALYVTELGEPTDDPPKTTGRLLRFEPGL